MIETWVFVLDSRQPISEEAMDPTGSCQTP